MSQNVGNTANQPLSRVPFRRRRRIAFELVTYFILGLFAIISLWTNGGLITYPTDLALVTLTGYTLILVLPIQKFKLSPGGVEGEVREDFEVPPISESEQDDLLRKVVSKQTLDPSIADKIVEGLKEEEITIDSTKLLGEKRGLVWRLPFSQFETVQQLLDSIWASLPRDVVKPYTYGKSWLLKDDKDKILYNIGSSSSFAKSIGRRRIDLRKLEDIDVKPGTRLYVVPAG